MSLTVFFQHHRKQILLVLKANLQSITRLCAELTRGAMTEFQEKLRQQHEESMHRELEALVQTAGPDQAAVGEPTSGWRGVQGGCHNALVALREQIFDDFMLSCTEVTVRRDGRSATFGTRTRSRNRTSKPKLCVIVEVIFVMASLFLFDFLFFLAGLQKRL